MKSKKQNSYKIQLLNNYPIYLCLIFFALSCIEVTAQVIGGREPNETLPSIKEPEVILGDNYSGNVNLFDGTYQSNYTLGKISTPGGLSFELNLTYSSAFTSGGTEPISKGIPYGYGWNLSIPTITINANYYRNYRQDSIDYYIRLNAPAKHNVNINYGNSKEGDIFYNSIIVNIPGKVNCRAVYKYTDAQGQSVFVPNNFDKYLKIRKLGDNWEVTLDDGTVYYFNNRVESYRTGPNKRGIMNYSENYSDAVGSQIIPKKEYLRWYCTMIKNPNLPGQNISFKYERYGKFNYFKEFTEQEGISHLARSVGFFGSAYSYGPLEVYKDILLKEIVSYNPIGDDSRIKLKYKTDQIGPSGLDFTQANVHRKDSLYSYKTVYTPNNYNNWKRYLHAAHSTVQSSFKTVEIPTNNPILNDQHNRINQNNPYLGMFSEGGLTLPWRYYRVNASGTNSLDFDHGFLESPRLNSAFANIPGDIYELKGTLYKPHNEEGGFCNFDINIVTGKDQYIPTDPNLVDPVYYNGTNGPASESIYSTFNSAVKWNTKGDGIPYNPTTSVNFSSLFSMPNLPSDYDGFLIQVGPANSDNIFNLNYQYAIQGATNNNPSAYRSYHRLHYNNNTSNVVHQNILTYYQSVPKNFGIGMPWDMMRNIYKSMGDGLSDVSSYNYNFWFKDVGDGTYNSPNTPTLAGSASLSNVELIRYTKNPYMLYEVETLVAGDSVDLFGHTGFVTTNKIRLNYEKKDVVPADNKVYSHGDPIQYDTRFQQSLYLLESINNMPVDPSNSALVIDTINVPTTHFEYTDYSPLNYETDFLATNSIYLLSRERNILGNDCRIIYYPILKDSSINYPLYTVHPEELKSYYNNQNHFKNRSKAIQVNAIVKKTIIKKGNNLKEKKKYEYSWQTRSYKGNGLALPSLKAYDKGENSANIGFKHVIVKNISADAVKNYIRYTYNNSSSKLSGKLEKVEYIDENNNLIKSIENTYTSSKAYEIGFERPAIDHGKWSFDYMDYYYQNFHNNWLDSFLNRNNAVDVTFGHRDAWFLEKEYSSQLSYNDSYFVRLTKKSEKHFDPNGCYSTGSITNEPNGFSLNHQDDNDHSAYINDVNWEEQEHLLDQIRDANEFPEIEGELIGESPLSDSVLKKVLVKPNFQYEANFVELLKAQEALSDDIYEILLSELSMLENETFLQLDAENENRYTERVLEKIIDNHIYFSDSYIENKLKEENQLSDSLISKFLQISPSFSQSFTESVLLHQIGLSTQIRAQLFNEYINLTDERLNSILKAHSPFPTDTILNLLISNKVATNSSMVTNVLLASPSALSVDVWNNIQAYSSYFSANEITLLEESQTLKPSALSLCPNGTSTNNLVQEKITEYEYYTATPEGISYSNGYKDLFGATQKSSVYLKYEPSWQLYRTKTYSPQYPGAFKEKKYYYYYDLLNRFDRYKDEYLKHPITNFEISVDTTWSNSHDNFSTIVKFNNQEIDPPKPVALNRAIKNEIRTTPYQIGTTTNNGVPNQKSTTKYTFYDFHSRWGDGDQTIADFNKLIKVSGDSSACPYDPCLQFYEIPEADINFYNRKTHPDSILSVQNLSIHTPTKVYKIDANSVVKFYGITVQNSMSCTYGNDTTLVYQNNLTVDDKLKPDNQNKTINLRWNLSDALLLGSQISQIDTIKNSKYDSLYIQSNQFIYGKNDLTLFGDSTIFIVERFPAGGYAYYEGYYPPIYPYDTLVQQRIAERQVFTLPTKIIDEKGMVSRFVYDTLQRVTLRDTTCNRDSAIYINYGHFNKPKKVIQYGKYVYDSLYYEYTYYKDYSIKSIIEPSGVQNNAYYDAYGRIRELRKNGAVINQYDYSIWNNDTSLTFDEIAAQNYIETIYFPNDTTDEALISRKYINPLGLEYQTVSGILENGINSDSVNYTIHNGVKVYDSYNRLVKQTKPFAYKESNKMLSIVPQLMSHNLTKYPNAFEEFTYETDWNGRIKKSAKAGEDITTGYTTNYNYKLMNSHCFACELGLTNAELSLIMPKGVNQSYVFSRIRVIDEDGKISDEYKNVFDQTIAKRQFTDSSEAITLMAYDNNGQLTTVINPKNQETNYYYNLLGWMYKKKTVDGGVSKYMFNRSGEVVVEQDEKAIERNAVRINSFDRYGRPILTGDALIDPELPISPLHYQNYEAGDSTTYDPNDLYNKYEFTNNSTYFWKAKIKRINFIAQIEAVKLKTFISTPATRTAIAYNRSVGSDLDFTPSVIHPNLQPFISNSSNQLGKVSYILRMRDSDMRPRRMTENDSLIEFTFFDYDSNGNIKSLLKQFNPNGLRSVFAQGAYHDQHGMVSSQFYSDYNNSGQASTTEIDINADGELDVQFYNEFDVFGNISKQYVNYQDRKANGNLIASYSYDPAFQRIVKKRLNYPLYGTNYHTDSVSYFYDLRNRLSKTESDWFDYELFYDNNQATYNGNTPNGDLNYNGNINGIKSTYKLNQAYNYSNGMLFDESSIYNYTYDPMNRLTAADAIVGDVLVGTNPAHDSYKMGDAIFNYDDIGNLKQLNRYISPTNDQQSWRFGYMGNTSKLQSAIAPVSTANRYYTYDVAGNLTSDNKRKISNIKYTHENLPRFVHKTTSDDSPLLHYYTHFLYNSDNQRIYKQYGRGVDFPILRKTTADYYLTDYAGRTIGIVDLTKGKWTWFLHGNNRVAKFKPVGVKQPVFYPGEWWNFMIVLEENEDDQLQLIGIREALQPYMEQEVPGMELLHKMDNTEHPEEPAWITETTLNAQYEELPEGYDIEYSMEISAPTDWVVYQDQNENTYATTLQMIYEGDTEPYLAPDESSHWNTQIGGDTDYKPDWEDGGGPLTPIHAIDFYRYDHLGNTRVVYQAKWDTPSNQLTFELQGAYDYFPYGKLLRSFVGGNGQERYLTTQHERDEESISENNFGTGLDNRGARFYDSDVAHFLSLDPAAADYPSWSDYNYVLGNPIVFIDPDGKKVDWYVVNSEGYFTGDVIKDDRTHGIQVNNNDGTSTRYAFNDQKNDPLFIEENIFRQKQYFGESNRERLVHIVNNEYVSNLQRNMSGGKSVWGIRHIYAQWESRGGMMDGIQWLFKDFTKGKISDIHRNEVNGGKYSGDINFFINTGSLLKKSYNFHDFGNYNWGGAMFKLGFEDLDYILDAANGNATGANDSDTDEDQDAIKDGFNDAQNY